MEDRTVSPCTASNTLKRPYTIISSPTYKSATYESTHPTALASPLSTLVVHTAPNQAATIANPTLRRFQQDLLILTSFPDNSTLDWRPPWFAQIPFAASTWTLHNPPDVVTERLPYMDHGKHTYTRRMRRADDPPPAFIKTRQHWLRVCKLYGVPKDFLCEKQVRLMRLGLVRDGGGVLCGEFGAALPCVLTFSG
jgi:hypothetical protein